MARARRGELRAGGRTRTFTLVSGEGGRPGRPLVVVFHGTAQTGRSIRRFSGRSFDALADTAGAVVVYPNGYRRDWNGAREAGTPAHRRGIDDVEFFTSLVDTMAATQGVARDRVYVAGFSLGGQMVMRLLADVPQRLAGAAIISSTLPIRRAATAGSCGDAAVPVMLFHGSADPLAPYDGGLVSLHGLFPRGLHLSAPDTAAYYAARNGITDPPVTEPFLDTEGYETATVTTTCHGRGTPTPVTLYTLLGGGHQIPNPVHTPSPWFWGRTCPDLVCADVIGEQFLGVPRPG